jgi:hypothetical protein
MIADGNAPAAEATARCVFAVWPARAGGIARGSSPLARLDAPNLVESHRALTKTGAVRVRWDREQLIGGKPERLVSRVLRVLVRGPDQWNTRIDGGAGLNCYCGIDWAEGHHDVAIIASDGKLVAKKRISDDPAGFTALTGMLADAGDSPEDPIPIAIQTPRGLLVAALRASGRPVFAINPMAVARYRERSPVARAKSDHADAMTLASILRVDAHLHRTLPADSELTQADCGFGASPAGRGLAPQ